MNLNNSNLCRLCFDEGNIEIFDENGQQLEIRSIIQQHLDCEVFENDLLPKCVCSICWNQVKGFHNFYEFVKKKQNEFVSEPMKRKIRIAKCQREQLSTNTTEELNTSDSSDTNNSDFDDAELVATEIAIIKSEIFDPEIAAAEGLLTEQPGDKVDETYEESGEQTVGRAREITNNGISDADSEESCTANESQIQEENGAVDASQSGQSNCKEVATKRKVGRPRKCDSETDPRKSKSQQDDTSTENCSDGGNKPKRGRGRPKKTKNEGDDPDLPKTKGKGPRGENAQSRSKYTLDKDYEKFMLDNFNMSCELCSAKDFKSFFDVKTHYMDAHQLVNGYVKCCNPKRKFIYISQVIDHIDYHLNPDALKCQICGHPNKSKALLRQHIKLEHEQKHRFACEICGQTFNRRPNLKMHILRWHVPKNPNIKCDQCDQIFSSKEVLKCHQTMIHEKQYLKKRFQCEICGKSLNVSRVESHRLLHYSKEERWNSRLQCGICYEWFLSPESLKVHEISHSVAQVECQLCHKIFSHHSKLAGHIRRMHTEREFKCTLCPSEFVREKELELHMESHTKTKQYPCMFCSDIFYVKKAQNVHINRYHRPEFDRLKRQRRMEFIGFL